MPTQTTTRDRYWTSPLAFVGSMIVHGLLAWLIITNLNSCGPTGDFGAAEVYREVGVFVEEDSAAEEETPTEAELTEALPELPSNLNESLTELPEMNSPLPDLPAMPIIGPGPAPSPNPSQADSQVPSSLVQPPRSTSAGIPSTTKFFNIPTRGRTVVYLIDCSGSMSKNGAFRIAKSELVGSLERLQSSHKFQVLFYNDALFELKDRQGKPEIHWATASNLSRARSFINGFDNSGGTEHYSALQTALKYDPEVLFFLTDGREPGLSSKQLDSLRRLNNDRTAIHCIEFGQGVDLGLETFLHKLSGQNGGTYRYLDTTEFANNGF